MGSFSSLASYFAFIEFYQARSPAMLTPLFLALARLTAAHPASVLKKRQSYVVIATFNDYLAQGNTNCGPKSGTKSVTSLLSPFVQSALSDIL